MAKFDSHPMSRFWSNKNVQYPNEVALNSHKKFLFDCDDCGHEFESSLLNINHGNNWCGFCSKPPKRLCQNDTCELCFNNSFASHCKQIYWSNENELTPRQVFKNADRKKFKFNCTCGHKIEVNLKSLTRENKWCKYCAHQDLCENQDCKMCFENSFASVEKSKYWSNENNKQPRQVFRCSNKKYKFNCYTCNYLFETPLSDIVKDTWCPMCFNKTERKLYNILKPIYPSIKHQFKVKWCKNKNYLPFDFAIEEKKIIIELDGPQHFRQISTWNSPEEILKVDLYKIKCANENDFSVIRLLQEDVYYDNYNWLIELINNIILISNENKTQNIFMSKNNDYINYL
jgi:very-short-patch-repair endonuclease